MKKCYLVLLLFSFTASYAQDVTAIQKKIDSSLWKPFKNAFESLDEIALNSLYAEQVLRVTPNGIDTENIFKTANVKRFAKNRAEKIALQLDFWFDSRQTNTNVSYEVGFYRMLLTNKKESKAIYGQFHIVLENFDGVWKITQDWDTTVINGNKITASDFEKKPFLEFK